MPLLIKFFSKSFKLQVDQNKTKLSRKKKNEKRKEGK